MTDWWCCCAALSQDDVDIERSCKHRADSRVRDALPWLLFCYELSLSGSVSVLWSRLMVQFKSDPAPELLSFSLGSIYILWWALQVMLLLAQVLRLVIQSSVWYQCYIYNKQEGNRAAISKSGGGSRGRFFAYHIDRARRLRPTQLNGKTDVDIATAHTSVLYIEIAQRGRRKSGEGGSTHNPCFPPAAAPPFSSQRTDERLRYQCCAYSHPRSINDQHHTDITERVGVYGDFLFSSIIAPPLRPRRTANE